MPASRKLVRVQGHPGIHRRGNRFSVVYRDQAGRQHKRAAKTLPEAKRLRAALQTDVDRGEHREVSRLRFDVYARAWVDAYKGRTASGITAQTKVEYRGYLERYAIPFFGKRRLADIRPRDIRAFIAAVEDGTVGGRPLKGSTVRVIMTALKALFATAFEDEDIWVNPAAGVPVIVRQQTFEEKEAEAVKALTPEQLEALLERIPEPWQLLIRFMADAGVRIGEAIELRWKDIDLGAAKVAIRRAFYIGTIGEPKSRYGIRTLRLTPDVSQALWRLRKDTKASDDDLVFTAERGGRIDQSNLASRILKPAALEAGIGDWVHFHTFRHTCATTLFSQRLERRPGSAMARPPQAQLHARQVHPPAPGRHPRADRRVGRGPQSGNKPDRNTPKQLGLGEGQNRGLAWQSQRCPTTPKRVG